MRECFRRRKGKKGRKPNKLREQTITIIRSEARLFTNLCRPEKLELISLTITELRQTVIKHNIQDVLRLLDEVFKVLNRNKDQFGGNVFKKSIF